MDDRSHADELRSHSSLYRDNPQLSNGVWWNLVAVGQTLFDGQFDGFPRPFKRLRPILALSIHFRQGWNLNGE